MKLSLEPPPGQRINGVFMHDGEEGWGKKYQFATGFLCGNNGPVDTIEVLEDGLRVAMVPFSQCFVTYGPAAPAPEETP